MKKAIGKVQKTGIGTLPLSANGMDMETGFFLHPLSTSIKSTYAFVRIESSIAIGQTPPTMNV